MLLMSVLDASAMWCAGNDDILNIESVRYANNG